jgi:hypothetical protein
MGLDSLLQQNMQNAGLAGIDRLARNAMFPQSQMDKTQYAVPSQLPTGAETIQADYDAPTNAYTGLPDKPFAQGGVAFIPRYDGEDGSQVEAPAEEKSPPTMAELADQIKTAYRTNENYDQLWKDFAATKEQDPQQWYKYQLDFLGNQVGWQQGQNTGERIAAIQPQIENTIAQAKNAGLSDQEINSIISGSTQEANIANQQRIAREAASGGSGLGSMVMPAATIAAMALAPELAPMFAGQLGTLGGAVASGALTGGALGGLGAGIAGKDIGQGIITGGATGAIGGGITSGLGGIDPNIAQGVQGVNTARNLYNVAQSGGQNIGADINAAKGIGTLTAASGGLMAGGGIQTLGSYSDGGQLLKGPGDGMSDDIPAKIGQHQPARLADGEFVVPADVVSHLGNGSTDAGAKQLYAMMDRIRKARTGNKKQGKQINPSKFLP